MKKINLNTCWSLKILGDNVYHIPENEIPAKVPGSVYSTLLDNGLMPDPFYRANELDALKLMDNDFVFSTHFDLDTEMLGADRLLLHFDGIDTLADITLNGTHIASVDDMHRTWEFDIKSIAAEHNDLEVLLHSPTKFIAEEDEKHYIGGSPDSMKGFPHLRKADCMFGWDWGPRLPDAGLFRDVTVIAVNKARISQVMITQEHEVTGRRVRGNSVKSVELTARVDVENCRMNSATEIASGHSSTTGQDEAQNVEVTVTAPDGRKKTFEIRKDDVEDGCCCGNVTGRAITGRSISDRSYFTIKIEDPMLWWPNGYGAHPLYTVDVRLTDAESGEVLDEVSKRIGLRTVTINQDPLPDEKWDPHMKDQTPDKTPGKNFAVEVNGLQIFAMGADYIPEDNILPRLSKKRSAKLLRSCVQANYNMIRIWGGGYFPDDYLFDLCDENGLLVWMDQLFACQNIEIDDYFEENVTADTRDNVRRLRHHACLAVWTGNNEMETQVYSGCFDATEKQKADYLKLYEYIIPKIMEEEDPVTFYWPSSPSSGGSYDNPWAENIGDTHYWDVWHGCKPFTEFRKFHFRMLSEFGFQSFPCSSTVRSFTEPGDRNIFSRVMEMHQRNNDANGKIMNYLSSTYLYPKNFDMLLYVSQLLQMDAIRYGVEHFRRFRGTCMGTIVWQLNDIWPTASWSSVDYYGRWKALHYAEKRMFAPILLSCEEHGEIDQKPHPNTQPRPIELSATFHVANETENKMDGTIVWGLMRSDSSIVKQGILEVHAEPYSGAWLDKIDFSDEDQLDVHLTYSLILGDEMCGADPHTVSTGSTLFCAPKHYHFANPHLAVSVNGDEVTVTADAFCKGVYIYTEDGNLQLSDNYFDMEKGSRTLKIVDSPVWTAEHDADLSTIKAVSVYDIDERQN